MRTAGATLIDKEHVVMREYLGKCLHEAGSVFGRRAARSPREVNEWVGFALVACGTDEDDLQSDRSVFFRGAVFLDFESPALCFAGETFDRAVSQDKSGFKLPDGTRGLKSDYQEDGDGG
jgi:hypothetical protein